MSCLHDSGMSSLIKLHQLHLMFHTWCALETMNETSQAQGVQISWFMLVLSDWVISALRSYFHSKDSGGECGVPYERRFFMPRPSLDQPW